MLNHQSDRIPIERYLEIRYATNPVLSYDEHDLFFISNITGIPQVWVQEKGVPWPRQLTFFKDRVMNVTVHPQFDLVCISADQGGTENAQLLLTDRKGEKVVNITNDEAHIYHFGDWVPKKRAFFYSSNKRTGRYFDIYLYDAASDHHQLILASDHTNYVRKVSPDGKKVLVSRNYSSLSNELLLMDWESSQLQSVTAPLGEGLFHTPVFSKDGRQIYCSTSWNSEYMRILRLDTISKDWEFIVDEKWDAEDLHCSPDGNWLSYTLNEDGQSRLAFMVRGRGHQSLNPSPVKIDVPAGVIDGVRFNPTSESVVFSLSSPRYGTEIWQYDLHKGHLERKTYASISGVSHTHFVEPESVAYHSFDGLPIHALYYKPADTSGPYPVVVYVHGGPESQSRNSFNLVIQYFVQEGLAVFAPNVRGSSGYGMTFMNLDNKQKRMDSVADLAAAVDWLVEKGNARKESIAVMGGSYGGFMVLAAMTHYPELWAAGVDIVGIANLRTFIENTSPYRRHLRESEYGTIEEDGEFFDRVSPIHHVDRIIAPLMVIHGANDPRVPVNEAEQMVDALRQRNHPVEYMRFEDEGHGIVKLSNRRIVYPKIAAFLRQHLNR